MEGRDTPHRVDAFRRIPPRGERGCVGIFDSIFGRPQRLAAVSLPTQIGTPPFPVPTSNIQRVAWSEFFGGELTEVTRDTALMVPAIKKARDILVTAVAGLPLHEYEGDVEVDRPWLYSSKSGVSPWHRMMLIADDLLFYDWSLLAVERDSTGQVTDAVRVPVERWSADADGTIRIDGQVRRPPAEYVLIPGIGSNGILGSAVRRSRVLVRWRRRGLGVHRTRSRSSRSSSSWTTRSTTTRSMTWSRRGPRHARPPTGSVGFSDHRVELRTHGEVQTSLFEEGRNAVVLDVARLTGLPAALLDGSLSTATLSYSTQEGAHKRVHDVLVVAVDGPDPGPPFPR